MLNYGQMYEAILNGDERQRQGATLQLCGLMKVAATAILELAGDVKLKTGKYPLMDQSRLILGDFIELDTERN